MKKVVTIDGITGLADYVKWILAEESSSNELIHLAGDIVQSDKFNPITKIFQWCVDNIEYTDESTEQFTTPNRMARNYYRGLKLQEDCDGMAMMACALCRAVGIKANVAFVDLTGQDFDHAICLAYCDKISQYILVDPAHQILSQVIPKYYQEMIIE